MDQTAIGNYIWQDYPDIVEGTRKTELGKRLPAFVGWKQGAFDTLNDRRAFAPRSFFRVLSSHPSGRASFCRPYPRRGGAY